MPYPSNTLLPSPFVLPGATAAFAVSAGFATADQVGARLGRDLTDLEETQVSLALSIIAALIREAVDKDDDWDPSPVPGVFTALSIEKAIGVLANPHNFASESERLGEHQHSHTFPRSADIGIFLSASEERLVRSATYGTLSGSGRVESVIDDHLDFADDLEINTSLEP